MLQARAIELGDRVEFIDRFHRTWRGTIVRMVCFGWCPGANSYTVYVAEPESSRVYGCSLGGFRVIEQPDAETRAANAAAAERDYREHLSQYPIWAARFAENPAYPVFGPSYL